MNHNEVRALEKNVIELSSQENLPVIDTISLLQTGTCVMKDQESGQWLLDALCIVKRRQIRQLAE